MQFSDTAKIWLAVKYSNNMHVLQSTGKSLTLLTLMMQKANICGQIILSLTNYNLLCLKRKKNVNNGHEKLYIRIKSCNWQVSLSCVLEDDLNNSGSNENYNFKFYSNIICQHEIRLPNASLSHSLFNLIRKRSAVNLNKHLLGGEN